MSNRKQTVIVAVVAVLVALAVFGVWSEQQSAERKGDRFVEDLRRGAVGG